MVMGLLIQLISIITVSIIFNRFQYFRSNETEYFGKCGELWLVNHSLSHLSTFLALHPENAHPKVDHLFPIYPLVCKFNFYCPDYGRPLSVAFFTVNTYLYLSWTEFFFFVVKWLSSWIHKIIAILFHYL